MSEKSKRIALIGAPTDIGAGRRGAAMGPEALRVAGLAHALRRLGHRVDDRGNLSGPINPERARENGYRHLPEVVAWCTAVRDAVAGALADGELPVLMGGDHCLSVGSIAAVARHCAETHRSLTVLWLDAHADYNVAESSPTGNVHGMPLAVAFGVAGEAFVSDAWPTPSVERAALVGVRSLDDGERELLDELDVRVYTMSDLDRRGVEPVLSEALDHLAGASFLHVSVDLDAVDPMFAPGVGTPVRGGLSYREAHLALELVEVNPVLDRENETALLAVELAASALGARIL